MPLLRCDMRWMLRSKQFDSGLLLCLLQNVEGWSKPGSLRIEAEAQTTQADAEVEAAAEPAPEPARARI